MISAGTMGEKFIKALLRTFFKIRDFLSKKSGKLALTDAKKKLFEVLIHYENWDFL